MSQRLVHSGIAAAMRKVRFLVTSFLALILFGSAPMNPYPQNYFASPLGIPISLAGSFAEMRTNHFHSGLDIKTNARAGYKVFAAADGWISRVSVSPSGFGNALYISHPNGYTTVYGHLDRFSPEIASFARKYQYEEESFRINAFPAKGRFRVRQGDVIAYSGNSGSSSGPHLHFEIRDSDTSWPINPALFGLNIRDTRPPRIYRIKMYGTRDNTLIRLHDSKTGGWRTIRGRNDVVIGVTRRDDIHFLSRIDRIQVSGSVGFGIQTSDFMNGSTNRLGAFRIKLESNGKPLFQSEMERFSFGQTRTINAHVDYRERILNRHWIQRSFVLPGNDLPFYLTENNGILTTRDGEVYHVAYRVSDAAENETVLPFTIEGLQEDADRATHRKRIDDGKNSSTVIRFGERASLTQPGARLAIPGNALFQDVDFEFDRLGTTPGNVFSPVYRVHDPSTALKAPITLTIDASAVPVRYRHQALLASVGSKGRLSNAGGAYKNGFVVGKISALGKYAVAIDSVGPRIRPLNISNGKSLRRSKTIRFRVTDGFSGVGSYRGEIDGQWVLFEYDAKNSLLRYRFDERVARGKHTLRLVAGDRANNESVYSASFSR